MVSIFGTNSHHLYVTLLEKPNESTIKTITSIPTFEHLVEAEKFVIDNAWKRYNECNFTKKFNEIMKNAKDYAYYLEITKGKQTDDNVKFIKKINKKIKLSKILIHRLNKINKEKDEFLNQRNQELKEKTEQKMAEKKETVDTKKKTEAKPKAVKSKSTVKKLTNETVSKRKSEAKDANKTKSKAKTNKSSKDK